MTVDPFARVLAHAIDDGLEGAALVDASGHTVSLAGAIAEEEALPLAALVMYRLNSARLGDLASRLFAGEFLSLSLEGREVAVGVAKRQLFVVAVLGADTPAMHELARTLRDRVADLLADPDENLSAPPWSAPGGSSSGPAELPLIELGITVRRDRGKA